MVCICHTQSSNEKKTTKKKTHLTYYINDFSKLFWISKYGTLTKLINNNLSDHDDLHFFNFYHKFIYVCGNFSLLNCTITVTPPPSPAMNCNFEKKMIIINACIIWHWSQNLMNEIIKLKLRSPKRLFLNTNVTQKYWKRRLIVFSV